MPVNQDPRQDFNIQVVRRENFLRLFADFSSQILLTHGKPPEEGLNNAFAAKVQIAKSAISSMKTGSRSIGDLVAAQVESLMGQPKGWLSQKHGDSAQDLSAVESVELSDFLELAKKTFLNADSKKRKLIRNLLLEMSH